MGLGLGLGLGLGMGLGLGLGLGLGSGFEYSELVPKEAETASGAAPGGSGGVPASAQRAWLG